MMRKKKTAKLVSIIVAMALVMSHSAISFAQTGAINNEQEPSSSVETEMVKESANEEFVNNNEQETIVDEDEDKTTGDDGSKQKNDKDVNNNVVETEKTVETEGETTSEQLGQNEDVNKNIEDPDKKDIDAAEEIVITVYFKYVNENGTDVVPADSHRILKTDTDKITVDIPQKDHFTVMHNNEQYTEKTYEITPNGVDITEYFIYTSTETVEYTVKHLFENEHGIFVEDKSKTQVLEGTYGTVAQATPVDVEGYTAEQYSDIILGENEDNTIEIKYSRNEYEMVFDANGGDFVTNAKASVSNAIIQKFGTMVEIPIVEKPGYEFIGWQKKDNTGTEIDPLVEQIEMPAENTTYVAQWQAGEAKYNISYWREKISGNGYDFVETITSNETAATETVVTVEKGGLYDKAVENAKDDWKFFSFEKADSKLVNGDGTTVVNVYYTRNEYTLEFVLAKKNETSGKWQVASATNGSISAASWQDVNEIERPEGFNETGNLITNTITAKYGADISLQWPAVSGTKADPYKFYTWGTAEDSKYFNTHENKNIIGIYNIMSEELITNNAGEPMNKHQMVGYWSKKNHYYKYHYCLEVPEEESGDVRYDGKQYKEIVKTVMSTNTADKQNAVMIDGYEKPKREFGTNVTEGNKEPAKVYGGSSEDTAKDIFFYYPRKTYTLKLYNGDKLIADETIMWGTAIDNYLDSKGLQPTIASNKTYSFDGWYRTNSFESTDEFTGEYVMPQENLTLYANWKAPEHNVSFTVDGKEISAVTVPHRNKIDSKETQKLTAPEKTGFRFVGWYINGVIPFSFEQLITNDMTITAKYVPVDNAVSYTVKYVNKNGEELTNSQYEGEAGKGVTVIAEPPEGYITDHPQQSIVLEANNENVVTFVCTKMEKDYTVIVKDEAGKELFKDQMFTNDKTVTVYYDRLSFEGKKFYTLNGSSVKTQNIANDKTIVFTVTENKRDKDITVENYDGVYDGKSHTITVNGIIDGDKVSYSYDGGKTWTNDLKDYTDVTTDTIKIQVKVENEKYSEAVIVEGTVNITPSVLEIEIIGNSESKTYTGKEQKAEGFKVTEEEKLPEGLKVILAEKNKAEAVGTDAGEYQMGLKADSFKLDGEKAANYNVTFKVTDGKLTITAAPVGPTEPTDPVEPVDPVEPTDPIKPTEPTTPVEPTEPTDPIKPTEPTTPVEPTEPTDPIKPTEPTTPVEPTEPTDPIKPTEPTTPVEPTEPTDPIKPTNPTNPVIPTEPTNPITPTEPTNPVTPTDSDNNGNQTDINIDINNTDFGNNTVTPQDNVVTNDGNRRTTVNGGGNVLTVIPDGTTPAAAPAAGQADDDSNTLTTIEDSQVPLAAGQAHWALLNLLLTIFTVLMSAVLLVLYFTRKREDDEEEDANQAYAATEEDEEERKIKRKAVPRILSAVWAVIMIIVFILTEDMSLPMQWTDNWTIIMAIMAIVQIVIAFFAKKKYEDDEEDDEMAQA